MIPIICLLLLAALFCQLIALLNRLIVLLHQLIVLLRRLIVLLDRLIALLHQLIVIGFEGFSVYKIKESELPEVIEVIPVALE